MSAVKVGGYIPVTGAMIEDAHDIQNWFAASIGRSLREMELDMIHGPRYGPPAPRVEIEPDTCPHCGHVLDPWDD